MLSEESHSVFFDILSEDLSMLESLNVIDYSLLVAVSSCRLASKY